MPGPPDLALQRSVPGRWSVYVLRCRGGALYTGIATDVRRRIAEHARKKGKGAKSLRGRGPLRLVFQRVLGSRGLALRVEGTIKKLPKARKEELILREVLVDRLIRLARTGPLRRGGVPRPPRTDARRCAPDERRRRSASYP